MSRTLMQIDPMAELREVSDWMDRMMSPSFFGSLWPSTSIARNMSLPIDVYETKDKLVVKAAVPGVNPDELEVSVQDRILTIRGETKSEQEQEDAKVYRREYSYGTFTRSIRLPEHLDFEKVDAEFDKGFVYITIPRLVEPEKEAKRIAVRAKK